MGIIDDWIMDLPQQFQGKYNIEILLRAFSRQLEEVKNVFSQLDYDTDLNTAVGKNLDRVGDIEVLSRKDAIYILRSAKKELTDDIYRSVLQYKAIQNNTNCTYYEIMDAMSLLWNTKNVTYQEDPERPATIIMKITTVNMDAIDPSAGRILSIRPSGVGIVYIVGFWTIAYFGVFEKIINPALIMHWKQSFFSFATSGMKIFDGTWTLDGNTLLDSAVISMPVSIAYGGIKALSDGKVYAGIVLGYQCEIIEQSASERMNIVSKIYDLRRKIRLLDGTWTLDGEVLLDSEYWSIPSRMINGSFNIKWDEEFKEAIFLLAIVRCHNLLKGGVISAAYKVKNSASSRAAVRIRGQTGCEENIGAWLISKKNMWYLDGSYSLDGSRYLNATIIKEAI